MTNPLLEALDALRKELPRAKTGFVKRFLPQIEEALVAGHSRKAVWERLRQPACGPRIQGILCVCGQAAGEKS